MQKNTNVTLIKNSIKEHLRFHLQTNKGILSGVRQFLVTENPLKMMKNAFYFSLKALFVLKVFKLLS